MKRLLLASGAALLLGVLGLVAGLLVDPRRTAFSYLAAFTYFVTLALGALVLVLIAHAVQARWFVAVRRLAEWPAATLPVFLLLVVPILAGSHELYAWTGSLAEFPETERRLIENKLAWLNLPFFAVRAYVYLLVWSALSVLVVRGSLRQDERSDEGLARAASARLQRVGAGGLPAVALTLTFAAFDWTMSLEPAWLSTVYGIYWFAGGFVAATALVAVLAAALGRSGALPPEVATPHLHAAGKLVFAFLVFWAYIAFVQLLIVWIADVPREVRFYLARSEHGWGRFSAFLVAVHFVIPFFLLLSREPKRRPRPLIAIGSLLLFAHYLDVYWLVLPVLGRGPLPHPLDLAALLAVGGALGIFLALRFRGRAAFPAGDPRLGQALRYRGS